MSITVQLCYNQANDLRKNSKPTKLKLTKMAEDDMDMPLPEGISCYTTPGGICVHAFDAQLKPNCYVWMVDMNLPSFFNEISGAGIDSGIQGLFLVGLSDNYRTPDLYNDKQHGDNGCPEGIDVGDLSGNTIKKSSPGYTKNRFTFNHMSFHPLIMIDSTIVYYVCDQGGPNDWPDNAYIGQVAVDQPIVYDATLGLYITRAAHLIPNNTVKKKVKKK